MITNRGNKSMRRNLTSIHDKNNQPTRWECSPPGKESLRGTPQLTSHFMVRGQQLSHWDQAGKDVHFTASLQHCWRLQPGS